MNKIVTICKNNYPDYKYHHLSCLLKTKNDGIQTDKILLNQYGLRCIGIWNYLVVDESKFTVFMLKYPEYIESIVYE
jgi:hypothetical protein